MLKKTGKIEHKVFKEQDLIALMDFLIDLKEEINHPNTDLDFEIRYEDGTANSGSDKSVFEDTKQIKTVFMRLTNYRVEKIIDIEINYLGNNFFVKSDDKDWVNAKFVRIKDIIDSTKNQNVWFSNENMQLLTVLLTGVLLGSTLYTFSFKELSTNSNPSSLSIAVFFGLSVLAGILIAIPLLKNLVFNFYPEIEFDTTREHLNKKKKKRSALWMGATIVALPFAINFISSLIFN